MIDRTMARNLEKQLAASERLADIAEDNAEHMARIATALEIIAARLSPGVSVDPEPEGDVEVVRERQDEDDEQEHNTRGKQRKPHRGGNDPVAAL